MDQNSFRTPKAPLEPLLLCVDEVIPDFDWTSVVFVTGRNNLRKLLTLFSYRHKSNTPLRINIQLAPGKRGTVLLNR